MEEIWKPIKGYEGRYEIIDTGKVSGFAQDTEEGNAKYGNLNKNWYLDYNLKYRGTTMDFINSYAKAKTIRQKVLCFVAKLFNANLVTPLGRIVLLPRDYNKLAIATGNDNMI